MKLLGLDVSISRCEGDHYLDQSGNEWYLTGERVARTDEKIVLTTIYFSGILERTIEGRIVRNENGSAHIHIPYDYDIRAYVLSIL